MLPYEKNGQNQTFHVILNPEREIPEETIEVHGITNEVVKDKPKFKDVAEDFLKFIEGATLIAHNAEFDESFIDQELMRINKGRLKDYCGGIVDTLQIARAMFPGKMVSLDALCQKLGIDKSLRSEHHGALLDAELLAQAYSVLKQSQQDLNIDVADSVDTSANGVFGDNGLVIRATSEELVAHEAFLDMMEKKNKEKPNWRLNAEEFAVKSEREREELETKKAALQHFIDSL